MTCDGGGESSSHLPAGHGALSFTAEESAWLAQHRRLRVLTKTEWAPIDLYTYEGQFRGLSGDYLAAISKRLGVCFDFTPVATLAESLEALQKGQADILPSVSRTPQREAFMDFSQTYLDVPNVYVARRGVEGVGPGRSMEGLRVAAERGYAVIGFVRANHPLARIVEFPNSTDALKAVSEGGADVYLGALPTTSFLVEKLLLTNLEVRGPWHSDLSALHLGVRKGDRILLGLLDKALSDITLSEREDIHRRWVPMHSMLAEPSPPVVLGPALQRLVKTLPALRVGYETDYKPYTFRAADGHAAGMAMDFLYAMIAKVGLRVSEPVGGPWSEVLAQARAGQLDLLVAVAANDERRRDFSFVGPWISTPNVLVTPRDAPPVVSLAQYVGRKVAVLRAGQTAYLMHQLHPHVELLEVPDRASLLAAVIDGRAAAAMVNATLAAPALAEGLGSSLKMAAFFPELNSELYFAVRKDHAELAQLLQLSFASLSEGERAAIASRWAVLPQVNDTGAEARAALRRLLPLLALTTAALLVTIAWGLTLRRAVQRRRAAEQALAQARDRAEWLARQRHEFLTEASHEIRAPTNAVIGALDQVTRLELTSGARELVQLARRAAQTLYEYVNNLLDLSKSDAGELRLVLQPDSLPRTLEAAVDAVAPIAAAADAPVTLDVDSRIAAHLRMDAFRIRQVVINLLSNALKFGAGSPVKLRAVLLESADDSQRIRIEVQDEGPGIPRHQLSSLFEPYVQAGVSEVHRRGSTGLGLALCRKLIDAMGGTIGVESAVGVGATVRIELTLPVVEQPGACDARATGDDPTANADGLRVLLIEDDRVQQIIIEAMLMQFGCVTDVAGDGLQAQPLWQTHRHRLVVTDLNMPRQNGREFVQWLRSQPQAHDVHVIGISADIDAAAVSAHEFDALIQKPVQEAALQRAVEAVLAT